MARADGPGQQVEQVGEAGFRAAVRRQDVEGPGEERRLLVRRPGPRRDARRSAARGAVAAAWSSGRVEGQPGVGSDHRGAYRRRPERVTTTTRRRGSGCAGSTGAAGGCRRLDRRSRGLARACGSRGPGDRASGGRRRSPRRRTGPPRRARRRSGHSPGRGPRGRGSTARRPRPAARPSAGGCRRSTPRARSSGRCRGPGPPSATGGGRAGPCPSSSCGGSGWGPRAAAGAPPGRFAHGPMIPPRGICRKARPARRDGPDSATLGSDASRRSPRPHSRRCHCTACGASVPAEWIRILAHRDDLAFVELDCTGCGSRALGLLLASDEPGGPAVLDVAGDPPGGPRRRSRTPTSSAMRDHLAGWDGDLRGLLADGR